MSPEPVAPDRDMIEQFVNAMFPHADEGTFASLRTFTHNAGDKPVEIRGVEINGAGLAPLIQMAFGAANRAARHPEPTVLAPPVATFNNAKKAREVDLANGLGLSVEIDANPKASLAILEGIIGRATVVVASGGEWTDPATGEVQAEAARPLAPVGADPDRRGTRQAQARPPPRYGAGRRRRDQHPGSAPDPVARLRPPEGRAEAGPHRPSR